MGELAAKEGDTIEGMDTHIVITDPLTGPKPIPGHKFRGELADDLSENVFIEGKAAAYKGSIARNKPPHTPNGMSFGKNPKNEGKITAGSETVFINGNPAARNGDTATTCNDPPVEDGGEVKVKSGTVNIGD